MGLGMLPVIKEVTLTLDTGAYADGDVMAATQEVANAVRQKGGRAVLQSVVVLDKDDQAKAFDLLILRTDVSIGTENAAVSITDTHADEILALVEIDDHEDLIESQITVMGNLNIALVADPASSSLFVAAICREIVTHTAAGITIKLGILQY